MNIGIIGSGGREHALSHFLYTSKKVTKIFNNPFLNEKEATIELEDFEALFIMRERTPMTKSLIENLPKLKYIMTSGMRNNAIDLETAKKKI